MSELHIRLLKVSGHEEIDDQLYKPEKSVLMLDEFEEHFSSIFEDALHRITNLVEPKFAELADLSTEHRILALINLRGVKIS